MKLEYYIHSAHEFPDPSVIKFIKEPLLKLKLLHQLVTQEGNGFNFRKERFG